MHIMFVHSATCATLSIGSPENSKHTNMQSIGNRPNPTMHQFHIPQCTSVCTFLFQNGASWDIYLMYCGICEMGLLCRRPIYRANADRANSTTYSKSFSNHFISEIHWRSMGNLMTRS